MTSAGQRTGVGGDALVTLSQVPIRTAHQDLRSAQKPPRGVSAYSLFVNRPAGRWVAAAALRYGVSPNQLSLLSGLFSLCAVLAIAVPEPSAATGLVAAVALLAGFVLDSADGQLARYTHRCTRAGEWLDHMVDCATKLALHGAILVAWVKLEVAGLLVGGASTLLLPLCFQFVAVLVFFGGTLRIKLEPERQERPPTISVPTPIRPLLMLPVDHGILCGAMVLWQWQAGFMAVYALMCAATAVYLGVFAVIWFRQLG